LHAKPGLRIGAQCLAQHCVLRFADVAGGRIEELAGLVVVGWSPKADFFPSVVSGSCQ